jgi:hypothetical protein
MLPFRMPAATVSLIVLIAVGLAACQSPQTKTYIDVFNKDTSTVKDKTNAVTSGCASGPSTGCTNAANDAKSSVDNFKTDLGKNPAPSCAKDVDSKLRDSLNPLSTSLGGLAAASSANDISGGVSAIDEFNKAVDSYNSAVETANKKQPNC